MSNMAGRLQWVKHQVDQVEGYYVVFGPADNQLLRDNATDQTVAVRPIVQGVAG